MKLVIFTLVEHIEDQGKYFGYAPYVREMDLWNANFDEITVVAPLSHKTIDAIEIPYAHSNIKFVEVPVFNIKSVRSIFELLIKMPSICFKMIRVMRHADHLHFRSPSNIAAIAAVLQMFFPKKKKTMRYAGNWDPNSNQPIGYRFQRKLFSNTFLTKNMTGLVYGKWSNRSKNINPFFAATFYKNEQENLFERDYKQQLKFIFSGGLVAGKRPLLAVKIIEQLNAKGLNCYLDIFGDGPLGEVLESYCSHNNLKTSITLHGNRDKDSLKSALKESHFVILPSKSEGWPKAIAEGMFFGCIPISTKISCVPWMLDEGKRGILIDVELEVAVNQIYNAVTNAKLNEMSKRAQLWSQDYTVEKQVLEINKILEL
ncbi:glycosyltransferase family 4 protein [Winogradskyella sp. UBA3174]|uniref:glycosyltransferase family 4 protein n=1 Tax=Winogradskyella sp. UBA3174 TaxID=1947785 RepID=UPI00260108A4|nr:glycosyltransferase [Winogradskyella sp. UBA3174]|tara:strand:+ start:76216 stop:77331 length:1116 start_codon:yes stop_codon:yes gene_type:complete